MLNAQGDTKNFRLLAGHKFLDLCPVDETGTSKTHTARLIRDISPRVTGLLLPLLCPRLTPSIIEAELFGCEKGSFFGAGSSTEGKFEAVAGVTLSLEIGVRTVSLRTKLLKIVEEERHASRLKPLDVSQCEDSLRDPSGPLCLTPRPSLSGDGTCRPPEPLLERIEQIVPLAHGDPERHALRHWSLRHKKEIKTARSLDVGRRYWCKNEPLWSKNNPRSKNYPHRSALRVSINVMNHLATSGEIIVKFSKPETRLDEL